jgi:hypothetical protein
MQRNCRAGITANGRKIHGRNVVKIDKTRIIALSSRWRQGEFRTAPRLGMISSSSRGGLRRGGLRPWEGLLRHEPHQYCPVALPLPEANIHAAYQPALSRERTSWHDHRKLHLRLQIVFQSHFIDQPKLSFQPIDMRFLAFEDVFEQPDDLRAPTLNRTSTPQPDFRR